MVIFNNSEIFATLFSTATTNVTGDFSFVLVLMILFFIIIAMAFRLPFEMALVFLLPLMFVLIGQTVAITTILVLSLIFLTFILYAGLKFILNG